MSAPLHSPSSGAVTGRRLPARESPPPLEVVRSARDVVIPIHSSWRSSSSCSSLQAMQRLATGRAARRLTPISSPRPSHSP